LDRRNGQRLWYQLSSSVFASKQRNGHPETAYPPKSCPRSVGAVTAVKNHA
jgi:hypothetical protein